MVMTTVCHAVKRPERRADSHRSSGGPWLLPLLSGQRRAQLQVMILIKDLTVADRETKRGQPQRPGSFGTSPRDGRERDLRPVSRTLARKEEQPQPQPPTYHPNPAACTLNLARRQCAPVQSGKGSHVVTEMDEDDVEYSLLAASVKNPR